MKVTRSTFKKDKHYRRVTAAVHNLLRSSEVVTPADVLIEIGNLSEDRFRDWRFGRVPYLERVITCNLSKAQRTLLILKYHAEERGLKPSPTVYKKWGKGRKVLLRFSKSGSPYMETLYSTHYVAGVKEKCGTTKRASKSAEINDEFA